MKSFQSKLFKFTRLLELLISISLVIAIVIGMLSLGYGMKELYLNPFDQNGVEEYKKIMKELLK
jgi:glucose-6-phosphate isomerase